MTKAGGGNDGVGAGGGGARSGGAHGDGSVAMTGPPMTEDQIKHMANRFLGWTLPENFNPDGGVSFKRLENRHHHPEASPLYPMPTGTNLFDATQADAMVRYMVEGMPQPSERPVAQMREALAHAYLMGRGFDSCEIDDVKNGDFPDWHEAVRRTFALTAERPEAAVAWRILYTTNGATGNRRWPVGGAG